MRSVVTTLTEVNPAAQGRRHWGQGLLLLKGLALGATGLVQACFDLAGHFLDIGPLANALYKNPDAIAYFEAHGLALIAATLLIAHRKADGPAWNLVAAALHLLLGGANLMFWNSFVGYGLVPMGIIATSAHAAFFALELVAAAARSPAVARRLG